MHHHHPICCNLLLLLGRICLSFLFIAAGLGKITAFSQTAALIASKGLPFSELLVVLAIIFELGGGLLVLFGLFTRLGALLLVLFIVPVSLVFHAYWLDAPASAAANFIHFFKNLAILGGVLYVLAVGGGCFSLDRLFCKKKCLSCKCVDCKCCDEGKCGSSCGNGGNGVEPPKPPIV